MPGRAGAPEPDRSRGARTARTATAAERHRGEGHSAVGCRAGRRPGVRSRWASAAQLAPQPSTRCELPSRRRDGWCAASSARPRHDRDQWSAPAARGGVAGDERCRAGPSIRTRAASPAQRHSRNWWRPTTPIPAFGRLDRPSGRCGGVLGPAVSRTTGQTISGGAHPGAHCQAGWVPRGWAWRWTCLSRSADTWV